MLEFSTPLDSMIRTEGKGKEGREFFFYLFVLVRKVKKNLYQIWQAILQITDYFK